MTYRGVYRDGIVILQGEVDLHNGDSVEVSAAPAVKPKARRESKATAKPKSRSGVKDAKKSRSASKRSAPALPGAGIWKDRWPESMSSAEVARGLRNEVSRRKR